MDEEKQKTEPKGYWIEPHAEGAKLLCFKGKWNGERSEKKLDLAALTVQEIKRDSRFAAYFKRLLEG